MNLFESNLFDSDTPNLLNVINNTNAGIWELDINSRAVKWSVMFYSVLGYLPGEIECSYTNLVDNLVYHQDQAAFKESLDIRNDNNLKEIDVRLLTKTGYKWFQSSAQRTDADSSKIIGTIIDKNHSRSLELELAAHQDFINERNKLIRLGGWEINTATGALYLNKEAIAILELDAEPAAMDELTPYFEPEYRTAFTDAINDCIRIGRPFHLDLKLKTSRGNSTWLKIKAVADIDQYGKTVKVVGVLQDIGQTKESEINLQSSLKKASHNNERLQNFAYIVSHNLRSYAGNLQLMLNLHDEAKDANDQREILSHIKSISNSLESTIRHLNEIVKIDSEKNQEKTRIEFNLLFKNIVNALQNNIQAAHAIVNYDFSACDHVYYLPAYLESIFHNLLSNALKYRSPYRQAVINCTTYAENGHVYIVFEDNGLGIDMEKYGDRLFGMYQKFHNNHDAQGIGLYITRNQVESLGGNIKVESTLNVGTKFIIQLV